MNYRLLAILLILLPAIRSIGSVADIMGSANSCQEPTCCSVVETITCCGLVTTEEVCSVSGGSCECIAAPADLPNPTPTPTIPLTLSDLILGIPETEELIVFRDYDDQPRSITIALEHSHRFPSNNTAQAILGVWRL